MEHMLISINGLEPFVRLNLLNARMAEIPLPENIGETILPLTPGAYVARFTTSAWTSDEVFVALPGSTPQVICPKKIAETLVKSAAPIPRSTGFLSRDAEIAVDFSGRKPITVGPSGEGMMFIMLRKRRFDAIVSEEAFTVSPWNCIELFDEHGSLVADLASIGWTDMEHGVACVHLRLPAGPYRLRIATANNQVFANHFLFVNRGFQTQLFLLGFTSAVHLDAPWATSHMSVHYAPNGNGFDPTYSGLLIEEELINILEENWCPRTSLRIQQALLATRCPLSKIAFWLSHTDPWTTASHLNADSIRKSLLEAADLPDAIALSRICMISERVDSEDAQPELAIPPLLARAWDGAIYAESHGALTIQAHSIVAKIAIDAVTSGPWVKFLTKDGDDSSAPVRSTFWNDATDPGLAEPEFASFVRTLRAYMVDEPAARAQLGSNYLTPYERLLVEALCPNANPTVAHILQRSGKRLSDEIPSEEDVIRLIRLPRSSLQEVAENALSKLFQNTAIPTSQQLTVFVLEESEREPLLREPLRRLGTVVSDIVNIADQQALSLLAVVLLRYRGSPMMGGARISSKKLIRTLRRLGFVNRSSQRKVSSNDLESALRAAQHHITAFFSEECASPSDIVSDDIEVMLAPPRAYITGGLCLLTKRTNTSKLSARQRIQWKQQQLSYSLSLLANEGHATSKMRPNSKRQRLSDLDEQRLPRDSYLHAVLGCDAEDFKYLRDGLEQSA